jgi:hypothetical protein
VTWLVVLLVFVVCVVFGIMRLVRHRIAWWLGLIAIFAIIAGSVVGFALYSINVGYT